jgi:hypothetical protein
MQAVWTEKATCGLVMLKDTDCLHMSKKLFSDIYANMLTHRQKPHLRTDSMPCNVEGVRLRIVCAGIYVQ